MIPIKLRGWDKVKKKMFYFNLSIYMSLNEDAQEDLCPYFVNDLMQFTGLLDKNGKNPKEELYYKDFMRIPVKNDKICIVEQSITGAWMVGVDTLLFAVEKLGAYKIGNFYENPELLK